ncbi:BspA family leucine-rich repeat surface protein [bacterium]|nr:BspA family leucine-rich repeat surface protein [bacterium]
MNKNIKYLTENLLDDFYDDNSLDIIDDLNKYIYKYFPKNKDELREIIKSHYKNNIYNLNDIDVSQITDFSGLFAYDLNTENKDFNISYWDVSNGEFFNYMFKNCYGFNCDLSKWDICKCFSLKGMFYNCSSFNCNLSKWNVSRCVNFVEMFWNCFKFNSDISKWDTNRGRYFADMFHNCTIDETYKIKYFN